MSSKGQLSVTSSDEMCWNPLGEMSYPGVFSSASSGIKIPGCHYYHSVFCKFFCNKYLNDTILVYDSSASGRIQVPG